MVAIPGYCKLSDSNVRFDIYGEAAKTTTSWQVPGPRVWGGAAGAAQNPVTATATVSILAIRFSEGSQLPLRLLPPLAPPPLHQEEVQREAKVVPLCGVRCVK